LQQRDIDRGRTGKDRGLVLGNKAQHILRHIARQRQGGGRQGDGNNQSCGEAVHVKEGQQGNEGVLVLRLDVDDVQHLTAVGAHVAVRQGNALGQARCAAGILQHDGVAQRVGNGGGITLRALAEVFPLMNVLAVVGHGFLGAAALFEAVEPVEREGKRIRSAGNDEVFQRQAVAQGGNAGPEQIEQHHVFCARILHVGHDFLFHIQGVGHDHHAPGLDDAPEGHHGLRHIGHHQGNSVPCLYADAA